MDKQPHAKTQYYISIGYFTFSFVVTALASGIVYGWPSLRQKLMSEEGSSLEEQELGAVFTIGSWTTQSSGFFFGLARDRWLGTRFTVMIAILSASAGFFGIAFYSNNRDSSVASLAVSLFFVGMGTGAQVCLQPVAELFHSRHQGLVISSLAGAFQLSNLVFLGLTSIDDNRKAPFLSFAAALLVLCFVAALCLPRHHFKSRQTCEKSKIKNVLKRERGVMNCINEPTSEESKKDISLETVIEVGIMKHHDQVPSEELEEDISIGKGYELSFVDQLKSAEYICLVLWLSILLIPLQLYIATIGYQLEQMGDENGKSTRLFSVLYASSAVISPLLGKISDTVGLGIAQALATSISALSFLFLYFDNISLDVHVIGMALYCIGRMMVFSNFFTNIGKRFGYSNYGSLSGLGLLISALISLLQYPLISGVTNGNRSSITIGCGVLIMCLLPYCFWLGVLEKSELNAQNMKKDKSIYQHIPPSTMPLNGLIPN